MAAGAGFAAIAGAFAAEAPVGAFAALPPIEGFLFVPCHRTFGFVPGAGSLAPFDPPNLWRSFFRSASFSAPCKRSFNVQKVTVFQETYKAAIAFDRSFNGIVYL